MLVVDEDKNVIATQELEQNPEYLEGPARKVYEVLNSVFPGCQTVRIMSMDSPKPLLDAVASVGFCIVVTAVGIFIFKRKNIN